MKPRYGNLTKALGDERKILLVLQQMVAGKAAAQPSPSALQHFQVAGAALGSSDYKKAVASCAAALDQSPNFAQAHAILGLTFGRLGYRRAEIACCKVAIKLMPGFAEAHLALAGALEATAEYAEAKEAIQFALKLKPEKQQAWMLLSRVQTALGCPAEASAAVAEAMARGPKSATLLLAYADALRAANQAESSLEFYAEACALAPDLPGPWANAGVALQELGRVQVAIDCYRNALAIRPDDSDIQRNLGTALQIVGRFDEAKAAYRTALALNPQDADAWGYLGATLMEAGELGPADEAFTSALALAPDDADTHFNRGLFLLKAGRLGEGWPEHEWRWRGIMPPHGIEVPQWRGEPAVGRRILLHWEQGFGDTLQFVRYAPLVAERGLHVTLEVQKPLRRLMESVDGVETVLGPGDPRGQFDLHFSLLSLPFAFETALDTIPAGIPYLAAPETLLVEWRRRVGTGGLKIGLVWAGKSVAGEVRAVYTDKRRSMAIAELAPLAAIPGVRWFSLQKESSSDSAPFALTDLMPHVADFADTAALIACLDLVITVDTAVVHLAGALGKPAWMLSRFDGCWRWLQGRKDSPWYPAMRIYHQTAPGDWGSAVACLAADLQTFSKSC